MSLVGPWLSTTSTKKRSEKITKSKQEEFERGWRERNIRLREMHLPKETFEQYMEWVYGRGKKTKKETRMDEVYKTAVTKTTSGSTKTKTVMGTESCSTTPYIRPTENKKHLSRTTPGTGSGTLKPTPTYTGSNILGISQMAKSNAVPVFSKDEMIEIARMRR